MGPFQIGSASLRLQDPSLKISQTLFLRIYALILFTTNLLWIETLSERAILNHNERKPPPWGGPTFRKKWLVFFFLVRLCSHRRTMHAGKIYWFGIKRARVDQITGHQDSKSHTPPVGPSTAKYHDDYVDGGDSQKTPKRPTIRLNSTYILSGWSKLGWSNPKKFDANRNRKKQFGEGKTILTTRGEKPLLQQDDGTRFCNRPSIKIS